jgi:hypothetical protein
MTTLPTMITTTVTAIIIRNFWGGIGVHLL